MQPPGRASGHESYHEPHARCLHTHPHHPDPEFDARMHAARDTLWVVTAVSNPVRFKTRYALYRKFRRHITHDLGLNLVTVEAAFGDRDHQLSDDGSNECVVHGHAGEARTIDVRVRNSSHVWLKENLWNIGARVLPHDCRYVLFCDADIEFTNRHIATEIVHALQDYRVVQPFETAADLGPHGEIIDVHRSFGWCHAHGWEWRPQPDGKGGYFARKPKDASEFGNAWHPGYAIAMRASVLHQLPLLEVGVLGAGDHHMAGAMIGKAHLTVPRGVHKNYRRRVLAWQDRAREVVNGEFGFVAGSILHHFHGAKANRRYVSRWEILVQHEFDPEEDAYVNSRGVVELADRKPAMRDAIKHYFRQRDEDSIAV